VQKKKGLKKTLGDHAGANISGQWKVQYRLETTKTILRLILIRTSVTHTVNFWRKFRVIFIQLFILLYLDLESNDSYGTSTLTIDQEHSSPLPGSHHHKFLPGNSSPSSHQYMSSPTQHVTTFTADNGYITVGKL